MKQFLHIRKLVTVVCACAAIGVSLHTQAQNVVISEIMYNPPDGLEVGTTNVIDGNLLEFIELKNTDISSVNLQGFSFTKGVAYTFTNSLVLAGGEFLVLAKDQGAFTNRYPGVSALAPGSYSGSLANGGERLTLKNDLGDTVFSVEYGDRSPWPEAADGHGGSLFLQNEGIDPDEADAWCLEGQFFGSPGEAGNCSVRNVVINEVLTHTDPPLEDAIELHNVSGSSVSIEGWYVSDEASDPDKYLITNTTPIVAGGYTVIYEYQFNTNALFDTNNTPFALNSAHGDEVYLTASNGVGGVGRPVDFVEVGAAENGVSFGRFPNATGDIVALDDLSLGTTNPPSLAVFRTGQGAVNGLPKIGPIVISEIMYNPLSGSGDEEYIELLNVSDATVSLYEAVVPTNTWSIQDAVDFVFPTNALMAADERILIIGNADEAAFRTAYGIHPSVQIFGPWSGGLNNSEESIRLYRPDTPEPDGFVPQILVDRVDYADRAPWPESADGNGPSLERTVETNYANTADNWFGGAIGGSPGEAPVAGFLNPQLNPANPSPSQAITATVEVVFQTLPTQVVIRTSTAVGAFSDVTMVDDGSGADALANDQTYTAILPGQPAGTRLYYQFIASGPSGEQRLPATEIDFLPSSPITVRQCSEGVKTTVDPEGSWATYTTVGPATHATCFMVYLNGAGEVLLDDVILLDTNGVNQLDNSTFDSGTNSWDLKTGNHSGSFVEAEPGNPGNQVMHILASGPGGSFVDDSLITQFIDPPLTIGETLTLSFRVRRISQEVEHWFWVEVGAQEPDVVINEIMYHPVQTNETAYEYIELYNPGSQSVDVENWRLGGVSFTVPSGEIIGADDYLVVCANEAAIQSFYGITNTVGDWLGQLLNRGEALVLEDGFGRELDGVSYEDQRPWPTVSDGIGPSLERLKPLAPATNAWDWAPSAYGTGWETLTWTQQFSTGNADIRFWLDQPGRILIDNVSMERISPTTEVISNGDFEAGLSSWNATNNHAQSRTEAGLGVGGSEALAVAGMLSRYIITSNSTKRIDYGHATSNCVYSDTFTVSTGVDYRGQFQFRRYGQGGTLRVASGGVTQEVGIIRYGTPGEANSLSITGIVVGVADVDKDIHYAPASTPNIIRAELVGTSAVSSVTLNYRTVTSNSYEYTDDDYISLAMADDGVAPDTVAGDGWFAAEIPGQANETLVRYHVIVDTSSGREVRYPDLLDPDRDLNYWVQSTSVQTQLPNWHLMLDGAPVIYPVGAFACAVSPDGEGFTDVLVRHRGRPPSSSASSSTTRSGIALRMNNSKPLDTWFANNQSGINFRSRQNDKSDFYRRFINEYMGYELLRLSGIPTPRVRHVCIWINGEPSITMSLEDLSEEFLTDYDRDMDGVFSRVGWAGRRVLAGDPGDDNFWQMKLDLDVAAPSALAETVQLHLNMEENRPVMAIMNFIGNGDQALDWNMMQYRDPDTGRWSQYPWDVDMAFADISGLNTNLAELHPYYETENYRPVFDTNSPPVSTPRQLGSVLFFPETGLHAEYTAPYRYAQQRALWRLRHTLGSTNFLFAELDDLEAFLKPAFSQAGISDEHLTNRVSLIKTFIQDRHSFLDSASWSDKNTSIWSEEYDPSVLVINEFMASPVSGGEYIELYNPGTQTIDVSWWELQSSNESYRLPHGTLIAPTSYLVVADTQTALTNAFTELADPAQMKQRWPDVLMWDFDRDFTSSVEYATRIIEEHTLTLPGAGAVLNVYDLESNLVDQIVYNTNSWDMIQGISAEYITNSLDNSLASSWRPSLIVGTPGAQNSASMDVDGDGMMDVWEQLIIVDSGGGFTNIHDILPEDDYDLDGLSNEFEFFAGADPLVDDYMDVALRIQETNATAQVSFGTKLLAGTGYELFSQRLYTLQSRTNLLDSAGWLDILGYQSIPASGTDVIYINAPVEELELYRYEIDLMPFR